MTMKGLLLVVTGFVVVVVDAITARENQLLHTRCAARCAAKTMANSAEAGLGGLKAMEEGVVMTLRDVAVQAGMDWESLGVTMKREGRLHLETY